MAFSDVLTVKLYDHEIVVNVFFRQCISCLHVFLKISKITLHIPKVFMTEFYIVMLTALVLIIGLWNRISDFKTAYVQALLFGVCLLPEYGGCHAGSFLEDTYKGFRGFEADGIGDGGDGHVCIQEHFLCPFQPNPGQKRGIGHAGGFLDQAGCVFRRIVKFFCQRGEGDILVIIRDVLDHGKPLNIHAVLEVRHFHGIHVRAYNIVKKKHQRTRNAFVVVQIFVFIFPEHMQNSALDRGIRTGLEENIFVGIFCIHVTDKKGGEKIVMV